ncbi:MAG: DUF3078 domain-containing protein [Paludibacteraceae bacterium]|nr:DUF3078 domain-containing protein [Paludibacteraceae bacterium]
MNLKHLIFIPCFLLPTLVWAEDAAPEKKDWQWSGIVGLNANATGMVNWAAGGKNNITGVAFGKVRLLYDKDNLSWDSNLDAEYGMSYVDQTYDKVQKASDHLKFDSKFGWAFQKQWYLTVQAGFQTQFDLGRTYLGTGAPNPVISNILAPSYTDISVGIDWKPNSIFSVYLSPVAGRITTAWVSNSVNERFKDFNRETDIFVNQTIMSKAEDYDLREAMQEKYGVWHYTKNGDNGYSKDYSNVKAELGLTLKGTVNYTYKDLKVMTGLTLYTPYAWDKTKLYKAVEDATIYEVDQLISRKYSIENAEYLGYRDNNRRFGNFDVDWTVTLSYQLLKCLNVTLSTNLKYVNGLKIADKDGNNPTERVQFLANLGLGVSYAF